jgi:PIN domain nuclease of toxin-antitoxin system
VVIFLLDTSTFLWGMEKSSRVSVAARDALSDTSNRLLLSIASIWEISIKVGLGKLKTPDDFQDVLPKLGVELLPISLQHTAAVRTMPFHHRDPFDRMLVAQARSEQAVVLTSDPMFARYGVATLW